MLSVVFRCLIVCLNILFNLNWKLKQYIGMEISLACTFKKFNGYVSPFQVNRRSIKVEENKSNWYGPCNAIKLNSSVSGIVDRNYILLIFGDIVFINKKNTPVRLRKLACQYFGGSIFFLGQICQYHYCHGVYNHVQCPKIESFFLLFSLL